MGQVGKPEQRTSNVALGDDGAIGGCAEEAGLGELLDSCLVQLAGVEG